MPQSVGPISSENRRFKGYTPPHYSRLLYHPRSYNVNIFLIRWQYFYTRLQLTSPALPPRKPRCLLCPQITEKYRIWRIFLPIQRFSQLMLSGQVSNNFRQRQKSYKPPKSVSAAGVCASGASGGVFEGMKIILPRPPGGRTAFLDRTGKSATM